MAVKSVKVRLIPLRDVFSDNPQCMVRENEKVANYTMVKKWPNKRRKKRRIKGEKQTGPTFYGTGREVVLARLRSHNLVALFSFLIWAI